MKNATPQSVSTNSISTNVGWVGRVLNSAAPLAEIIGLLILGYFLPYVFGEWSRWAAGKNAEFGDTFAPTYLSAWATCALLFARMPWNSYLQAVVVLPLAFLSTAGLIGFGQAQLASPQRPALDDAPVEFVVVLALTLALILSYAGRWGRSDHSIAFHRFRAWRRRVPAPGLKFLVLRSLGFRRMLALLLWTASAALTAITIAAVLGALFQGNHLFRIFILDPMVNLPEARAYEYSRRNFFLPSLFIALWNLTYTPAGLTVFCLAVFLLLVLARSINRLSRRLLALHADRIRQFDRRRPVIFLRSFAFDRLRLNHPTVLRLLFGKTWRMEEALADRLSGYGPFFAIGAPEEKLPQLGAARAYFGDETWQDALGRWLDEARLIVMVPGETRWVRWELGEVRRTGRLTSLIIIMPPVKRADKERIWALVCETLEGSPWEGAAAAIEADGLICATFAADGTIATVTGRRLQVIDLIHAIEIGASRVLAALPATSPGTADAQTRTAADAAAGTGAAAGHLPDLAGAEVAGTVKLS